MYKIVKLLMNIIGNTNMHIPIINAREEDVNEPAKLDDYSIKRRFYHQQTDRHKELLQSAAL